MTGDDRPRTIEELQQKIRELESQVKKLFAGELVQYDLQSRLDLQLKVHIRLLSISQQLHGCIELARIGEIMAKELVDGFDYEFAVVFSCDPDDGSIDSIGHEGYYRGFPTGEILASAMDLALSAGTDRDEFIRFDFELPEPVMGMNERVVVSCLSRSGYPNGFFIAGNSADRKFFHRRVAREDRQVFETIGLIFSGAMENAFLYRALNRERESLSVARDSLKSLNERLEGIVRERTAELMDSQERYRVLYLEADRTGKLYRALLDVSPDPVIVYDVDGVPTYINRAFSSVFGWGLDDLVRRNDFIPPDCMPETADMRRTVFEGGSFINIETRRNSRDLGPRDVLASGSAYHDEKGGVAGSVVYLRDVTERKMMENELLKVRKLESIGLLAGGIAHDFNNILTGIIMNAQMAQMQVDQKGDPGEFLKGIVEATQNAVNLTTQLLTFAKGGSPVKKTIELGSLIREWVHFVMSGSQSVCEFQLADDLRPVDADQGQISQVIHNLVINALQSMPRGGTVKVRAENVDLFPGDVAGMIKLPGGSYVRISVEDCGNGIPDDQLGLIFDPFYSTKEAGSGLGLAISFSIVRKHGGTITVESEVDRGSVFSVYIPVSAGMAPEKKRMIPPKESSGDGRRVLVVDDEQMVRTMAAKLLTVLGYRVESVADGVEAERLYRESLAGNDPFFVVIMDLTIPGGMGGVELMRRLLEIDPGVRAVVSSGYSNNPVMANYREHGFCGILEKPYRMEDLRKTLEGMVNGGPV